MIKKARKRTLEKKHRKKKTLRAVLKEEQVKRGSWMLNVPTSFDQLKGLISEEKAIQALKYFQQKGMEFYQVGAIANVIPTQHYSEEDKRSIDIKVSFQNGAELLVEVKNSWNEKLEKKLRKRKRCLMAIPWKTTTEETREIVQNSVNRFFQKQEGSNTG